MDLTPTEEEIAEQQAALEPSFDEVVEAKYREIGRDKRDEHELGCPSWTDHCNCEHMTDQPHTSREGTPWCPTHQAACADGPHPFLTLEQFRKRLAPVAE